MCGRWALRNPVITFVIITIIAIIIIIPQLLPPLTLTVYSQTMTNVCVLAGVTPLLFGS